MTTLEISSVTAHEISNRLISSNTIFKVTGRIIISMYSSWGISGKRYHIFPFFIYIQINKVIIMGGKTYR